MQYDPVRVLDRFTDRIIEDPENGCWNWQGAIKENGYGAFGVMRSGEMIYRYAHRYAYEEFIGPIPEGLHIDHLCRNRACANPGHLEPVTPRENLLRGETFTARHLAAQRCPEGHPYDDENTYIRPGRGGRDCKACRRARKRKAPAS